MFKTHEYALYVYTVPKKTTYTSAIHGWHAAAIKNRKSIGDTIARADTLRTYSGHDGCAQEGAGGGGGSEEGGGG